MNLNRVDGESTLDYHKRLIYGKLVDKTLSDVDYTELAEIIYGQPYSSDVARRMMYGSRKTLEEIDSCNFDSDNSEEISLRLYELQKERQRFFDQRREFNKILNNEGRIEHLYDVLESAALDLTNTVGKLYDKRISFASDSTNNEAILVFSDWHYGMTTDNIYNKFNTGICKERVKSVTKKAAERILNHGCKKLNIVILGDLFHGAIHTSARVASEELVCDQIMQVSEILAQSIEYLSPIVESTEVFLTYGNHGRTVANKKENIHRDNIEKLVGWWLEQRLSSNKSVEIHNDYDNEFIVFNACGHGFCASHGDLDRVGKSSTTLHTLFSKKYGIDVEYIILGDKHHSESFDSLGITSTICGSICGTDDYANDRRLYSTPSQLLIIVNPDDGADAEYKIKC